MASALAAVAQFCATGAGEGQIRAFCRLAASVVRHAESYYSHNKRVLRCAADAIHGTGARVTLDDGWPWLGTTRRFRGRAVPVIDWEGRNGMPPSPARIARAGDAALECNVPDDPRSYLGQVLRLTVSFLSERNLLEAVSARTSPEARRALQNPPFLFAWVPATLMDDVFAALYSEPQGPELCAELGHYAARKLSGSVLAPVLKMAMSFFGTTPASVFSNLDRFYSIATRGTTFSYEPVSPVEGVVRVQVNGDAPDPMLHVTRGNLRQAFNLCQTNGEIGLPERVRGNEALFRARWRAAPRS